MSILSSRDIDDKILTIHGIKKEGEKPKDPMAAVLCPRCKLPNPPDMMYCGRCSMALNEEALKDIETIQQERDILTREMADKN